MIYCVEDERNIRELLIYTLETTGFQARGFETGRSFGQHLKKSCPSLFFSILCFLEKMDMRLWKK